MQDLNRTSGSTLPVVPPKPTSIENEPVDPYARLSFAPAAPDQILRAYQRDGSHVQRLSDLVSDLLRSVAGSRWLARRQLIIDTLAKTMYLALTLGRSRPTLGEEYTDITPYVRQQARVSRMRRLVAICFLLLPSALTSSTLLAALQHRDDGSSSPYSLLSTLRRWTVRLLESPLGQSLPEISTIAFLYGGTFLEFGRRVAGLPYISTTYNRSIERATYEPVSLLLALPLAYRMLQWCHDASFEPPGPARASFENTLSGKSGGMMTTSDEPNTYLTDKARRQAERQCTLCLEPRGTGEASAGTVAVTECGHAFCWGCLAGLDKTECPLCRQSLRMERLIAAYNL